MRPLKRRLPSPRSCAWPTGVSRAVVPLKLPPLAPRGLDLCGSLHDLLLLRVPLEARLGLEVPVHGLGGHEDEARVRLRGPRNPAGDVVEVELHDRQEALQVWLLID